MRLSDWEPEPDYSSDSSDLVREFYLPALNRSLSYDRISGYFRSTVYLLIWKGLIEFIDRGGRIRILCSPELGIADGEALVRGYRAHDDVELAEHLGKELDEMLASPMLRAPAIALAGLVANGLVDLRLATVARGASLDTKKMFHDKVGLFTDAHGDALGFRGSANETFSGLSAFGNVESIDAFPSWCDGRDAQRAARARERFDRLWSGDEPGVNVRPVPDDLVEKLRDAAADSDWRDTVAELDAAEDAAVRERNSTPSGLILREQQATALDVWEASGRRGILEHATGSGKTITGVTAVARHLSVPGTSALVIVPSTLLLSQWVTDLRQELSGSGVTVHPCGSGNSQWKDLLRDWVTDSTTRRVVVAVVNSARSKAFLSQMSHAQGLLVVADEVHRLGASGNRRVLELDAEARLGLSATPDRAGDPEGTAAIMDYFGGVIHRFGLQDAIAAGLLTPYRYEVAAVALIDSEQEEWAALSKKIRRQTAIARSPGSSQDSKDRLNRLLIQRSRISKQAAGKVPRAAELVADRFESGQRWLVYCDDIAQLDELTARLRDRGLPAAVYHSEMAGDAEATLTGFRLNGGILVSIKCLDEGVDIPAATHALILASSRNPREFIQRRGRVLRRSPDKPLAHVLDLLTVPRDSLDQDTESLVWGEISRAAEFAAGATNADARFSLEDMCIDLGVDLADLYRHLHHSAQAGFEPDEDL